MRVPHLLGPGPGLGRARRQVQPPAGPGFPAQGAGAGNITTFLQNIVNIITGTAGKLIAVIAIALVGIAWMFGAASARTAGGVIVGVILVFSASWIVDQIVGT